jgi:hypothetical protein
MSRSILAAALAASMFIAPALALAATCASTAMDKKYAGAAKTSFMKKCEADAAKDCDAQAATKKYYGAVKISFTKKCVADATGE